MLRLRPGLLWSITGTLTLIGLPGLLYVLIDGYGASVWRTTKSQLLARGEPLDREDFTKRRIPAEQNKFDAPMIWALLPPSPGTSEEKLADEDRTLIPIYQGIQDLTNTAGRTYSSSWLGNPMEIEHLQLPLSFPGDRKLTAETRMRMWSAAARPYFDRFRRQIHERPEVQFPFWRFEGKWQYNCFSLFYGLSKCLCWTAIAHLRNEDSEAALRDLELILDFASLAGNSQTLQGVSIEIPVTYLALEVSWEGMRLQVWTRDDLARIQSRLKKLTLLQDFKMALRLERILQIDAIETFFETSSTQTYYQFQIHDHFNWLKVLPHGLRDLNKAALANHAQRYWIDPLDTEKLRFNMESYATGQVLLRKLKDSDFKTPALRLFAGMLDSFFPDVIFADSRIKLAGVACALEAYRSKTGDYPDRLEDLIPKLLNELPRDLAGERAPSYSKTPDGSYRMWFWGWNNADDGCTPSLDPAKSDVVWIPGQRPPVTAAPPSP